MVTIEEYLKQGEGLMQDAWAVHQAYPDAEFLGGSREDDATELTIWHSPSLKPADCNFVFAMYGRDGRAALFAARRFGDSLVVLRDRFASHELPINAALQSMRTEQPALHAELLAFIAGQQL